MFYVKRNRVFFVFCVIVKIALNLFVDLKFKFSKALTLHEPQTTFKNLPLPPPPPSPSYTHFNDLPE